MQLERGLGERVGVKVHRVVIVTLLAINGQADLITKEPLSQRKTRVGANNAWLRAGARRIN
jgi:hypothetical protein